jgi:hypothetical protein
LRRPAASLAAEKAVAPSIGFRFRSDWTYQDPDDWDPFTGRLDICRYMHADVEEVSLTPSPQLPTNVLAVW